MRELKTVLLTGATGYIGSHTWCALLEAGYDVIGVDNLCNSDAAVIGRIEQISGRKIRFEQGDVRDEAWLDGLFEEQPVGAVIHFAALKAVGESVRHPLDYYDNNLNGLFTLAKVMQRRNVKKLIFSSSATVYGHPKSVPIAEDFPLSATNPYGQTKLMSEQVLRDVECSDQSWRIGYLRYFNPVGAHPSGMIGEDPGGLPNNLMPYVAQVAIGKLHKLSIYGKDYPTLDGTGVRDYIHVMDLAEGHVAALSRLAVEGDSFTVNLGTGRGYSVLEVIAEYEKASSRPIPYEVVARRPGDIAECYADPSRAQELLGWRAHRELGQMCTDSWRWQRLNPEGFANG